MRQLQHQTNKQRRESKNPTADSEVSSSTGGFRRLARLSAAWRRRVGWGANFSTAGCRRRSAGVGSRGKLTVGVKSVGPRRTTEDLLAMLLRDSGKKDLRRVDYSNHTLLAMWLRLVLGAVQPDGLLVLDSDREGLVCRASSRRDETRENATVRRIAWVVEF